MRITRDHLQLFGGIASYYWRTPFRLGEVFKWYAQRRRTTMELEYPWWNYRAVRAVEESLPTEAVIFEYGGGGSTIWLSGRGASCTTVEHDESWYSELRKVLPESCVLLNRPPTSSGSIVSPSVPNVFFDEYVHAIDLYPDSSFDLVIVDGRARVDCGKAATRKIKPGGMLLLDDSDRERYLPLRSELQDWAKTRYRGLKAGGGGVVETTIWTRPTEM